MEKQKGFTLIELLVVVAIIALLVSILVPALTEARTQAQLVVDMSNHRQIVLSALAYAMDNEGRFPPSMASLGPGTVAQDHPNDLNYNVSHISDYLGIYLASGSGDVFLSPLGPPKPDWFDIEYKEALTYTLMGSYFMLWNFDCHAKQPEPIRFIGAKSTVDDADELLTQTAVTWWIMGHATGFLWRDAVTWDEAIGPDSRNAGMWFSFGAQDDPPGEELPINAGFRDGSVQRFNGADLRYRDFPGGYGWLVGFFLYDPELRSE